MINLDKIKSVNKIYVHENCSDGKASAMILNQCLPGREIIECSYNTKLHLEMPTEPGVLFCDFSPHKSRVDDFLNAGAIVLDHHKTTKEEVLRFQDAGLGAFGDEQTQPGVCGAVLAYNFIYENVNSTNDVIKTFAELAGIRDTWVKESVHWQKACEQASALFFYDLKDLLNFQPNKWEDIFTLGEILFKKQIDSASQALNNSYSLTTKRGTQFNIFSGLTTTSDANDMSKADIVVGFNYKIVNEKMNIIYSCRSHKYDVGSLAKANGGGGHTLAAGFSIVLDGLNFANPFNMFLEILEKYEH